MSCEIFLLQKKCNYFDRGWENVLGWMNSQLKLANTQNVLLKWILLLKKIKILWAGQKYLFGGWKIMLLGWKNLRVNLRIVFVWQPRTFWCSNVCSTCRGKRFQVPATTLVTILHHVVIEFSKALYYIMPSSKRQFSLIPKLHAAICLNSWNVVS